LPWSVPSFPLKPVLRFSPHIFFAVPIMRNLRFSRTVFSPPQVRRGSLLAFQRLFFPNFLFHSFFPRFWIVLSPLSFGRYSMTFFPPSSPRRPFSEPFLARPYCSCPIFTLPCTLPDKAFPYPSLFFPPSSSSFPRPPRLFLEH